MTTNSCGSPGLLGNQLSIYYKSQLSNEYGYPKFYISNPVFNDFLITSVENILGLMIFFIDSGSGNVPGGALRLARPATTVAQPRWLLPHIGREAAGVKKGGCKRSIINLSFMSFWVLCFCIIFSLHTKLTGCPDISEKSRKFQTRQK